MGVSGFIGCCGHAVPSKKAFGAFLRSGLHNVNQLVNKYENVFKETEMERGYFIQKLRIEER